jgi:hypothetical protein
MDEAYVDYERALHQAKVVCDKIDEEEPNRAAAHIRKALKDLNGAITHIEKADVGQSYAGAVDAMNKGSKELDEAATALDNGEVDSAQRHYNKAADSFGKADEILS